MQSQTNRRICPGAVFRRVGQRYGGANAVGLRYLQGKYYLSLPPPQFPLAFQSHSSQSLHHTQSSPYCFIRNVEGIDIVTPVSVSVLTAAM